ncbi:hypothetical protein [Lentilactobacillus buchneri]|uniref:hypothetical protein n=1 Tax=Lentilactobacillus buchneri TaxID=1581 RepID=UPI002876CFEF|nr:hypothetical protein [Lentilactobacillus buchneri]MDS1015188.1 hypothetical protein [Lentilactobacillus buchneri]
MSKELAFTDDNDVVKYLDTTTVFNLALTADGVAFDLTNAKSVLVKIANDDGYIMQQTIDLTTVTSPLGGTLSFPINQDIMNTLVPDDYDIEVWVTMNDGTQAIFPSDGTLGFSIEENLMSDTGEVIPVITFDQFEDQFNDMMTQMQNTVSNVKKGDKGDKGDTGSGLEIKDKVLSVSNLPSTANEGDGYLVGEELYVWVNGAWKDCGPLQGPKGDQGPQGIQGNTGTGISSTTVQYQISSSATTAPTETWSDNIIATTTTNPYLWMKATLNYTDNTTKDFYLVSQKGDKGDKGDTGATGPVGPQGPVGSGLVVKGTVNNASQLPTTGNQEGYCYFVGTDLYVWDAGAWKNCGSVSPDLSNYVTITDLNNGLSTKVNVSDMRKPASDVAGIEEVSTLQTQVDNSAVGTNLLTGTSSSEHSYTGDFSTVPGWSNNTSSVTPYVVNAGSTYTYSIYLTKLTGSFVLGYWAYDSNKNYITWIYSSIYSSSGKTSWTFTVPDGVSYISPHVVHASDDFICTAKGEKLELGSHATDWCPNPEDKVNVADMRKPASDIAGIEEVNAKQDKLTITPADDSKVVHTSGDEEIAGAKTFDTAPIDKATGHPYITKDGVPAVPDTLADTTKDANFMGKLQKSGIDVATTSDVSSVVNTATANMANTTKLANFTAGLQVNGKDVGAGGGDTLTTPWVTTNHFGHGANDLDSLGIEEITGWRIKNDVLYYDATFMRNDTDLSSLTVVFDLYTAIPNFKTTFKTTENGPHMMFIGVGNAKAAFNFGSDFVPNNIGNIQIMLSGENASLPIHIVYPLDRL